MEDTTAIVGLPTPPIRLDLTIPPTQVMEIIRPRFSTRLEVYVGTVIGVVYKNRDDRPALVTDQQLTMLLDNCYRTTPEIAARLKEWEEDFERMMQGAEDDLTRILADAGSVKIVRGKSELPGTIQASPAQS